jgi:hypothetical protein
MGWWDVSKEPEVVTGDDVLDLVRHFLKDFSRAYQEDLSRKPSLAELEYALNLAFRVNVDDEIVSGVEELEVKQVLLKTAKRPKRVRARVGDVFAFRVTDKNLFGFGRLVASVSVGMVAEVFDYFSQQPILDYSRRDNWLFSPIIIDQYTLFENKREGDWRIIDHLEGVDAGKLQNVRFVYGEPPNGLKGVRIDDSESAITQADARGLRNYSAMRDAAVQRLVSEALDKKPDAP